MPKEKDSEVKNVGREVHFVKVGETKGTYKYQELDAHNKPLEMVDSMIGQIYLRKAALGKASPDNITVSVTW